jgi:hypothetical protein
LKRLISLEDVKLVPESEVDVFLLGMAYKRTFENTVGCASVEVWGKGIRQVCFSADKLREMFKAGKDVSLSDLVERILVET